MEGTEETVNEEGRWRGKREGRIRDRGERRDRKKRKVKKVENKRPSPIYIPHTFKMEDKTSNTTLRILE